jgi:signal transduction histidine kinase
MQRYWITWKSFFIGLPFNIIAVIFLVAPSNLAARDYLLWTLIGICAHVSLTPTVFVFSRYRTWLHSRRNEIIGLVIAGAFRGIVIDVLVRSLDLYQSTSSISRIINSSITIPVFGAILFFVFDSRNQFERQFRELFGQALIRQMELNSSQLQGKASPLLASARAKVGEAFKPLLDSINEILSGKKPVDNLPEISLGIRGMLDKSLRPMSHELWSNQELAPPKFRISGLLRLATLGARLHARKVNMAVLPFGLIGTSTRFGFADSIVRNLTSLIVVFLIHQIYTVIVDRSWLSLAKVNFITLIIYALVPGFIPRVFFPELLQSTDDTGAVLVSGIIFASLIVVYNLVKLANSAREQVLDLLRDQVERGNVAKYAESFAEIQGKIDFASYLHGEVQSELIATSLSLQKASAAGDVDGVTQALERAAALLRRDHSTQDFFKRVEPAAKMASIAESWKGIAEILYRLPDREVVSDLACNVAVQACEEIIANAVRHGGANKIEIDFRVDNDLLKVSVADNGKLNPASARGLGSSLLDRLTLNWSRENSESGHCVNFEIAHNK